MTSLIRRFNRNLNQLYMEKKSAFDRSFENHLNRSKLPLTKTGSNILGNNFVKAISNTFYWRNFFGSDIDPRKPFEDCESNHKKVFFLITVLFLFV